MEKATYCVGVENIGIPSYVKHEIPEIEVDESTILEPDVDINESYGEIED